MHTNLVSIYTIGKEFGYLALAGTPSWSTLRRQECAQHQHAILEHIARATSAVEEYITPTPEVYPALRHGRTRLCADTSVRRLLGEEHGVGSPKTSQMSLVECGHVGHFLVRGVKSFSRATCSLLLGWIPLTCHEGRSEFGAASLCLVHADAHLREEPNLHLSKEHAHEGAYLDQS